MVFAAFALFLVIGTVAILATVYGGSIVIMKKKIGAWHTSLAHVIARITKALKKGIKSRRFKRFIHVFGSVLLSVLVYVHVTIVWNPPIGGPEIEIQVKEIPPSASAGGQT